MDSKQRFTDRVETYVKYRPSYPATAIDFLYGQVGFKREQTIADIGSGTGIFSRLLLERGSGVIGVEPNEAMRNAASAESGRHARYRAVDGSAEETGLAEASVDQIVCAQAFHWFDQQKTRSEFRRILKPDGKVVLIWNTRKSAGSPFAEQFERLLLTYGTDYEKVVHKNITQQSLRDFFAAGGPELNKFSNVQLLDERSLQGRLLSSSYCPLPGHPSYEPLMAELGELFARYRQNGVVTLEYETDLYWGSM